MPSSYEQLSPTRVKFTVEVPFADIEPAIKKTYKEIAQQINIPGFRKGKVPAAVIDQRFGRGVVLQEALNEVIPDAYEAAAKEAGVVPMGQPEVEVTKLEDHELVEFTAEVDIRPEFDLPAFEEIELEVEAAEVTEADIDERVELLRERFATNETVKRPAAEGDMTIINLVARQDGVELADGSATDLNYKVGQKGMIEGLAEAVTGLSAGESKTFTATLVGGTKRGTEADIEVTVNKVQSHTLPEVDDEFAELVSEFDTVDEMRADLKGGIELQKKNEQLADVRDKVLEEVLKLVDFPLPETLLENELKARKDQVNQQLAQAGLTVEQYLEEAEDETAETAEEFWADIEKRGTDALRAQIVLDRYAESYELSVDQQDFTELLFRKARMHGTTPEQEAKHMMDHGHTDEWVGEIRRGKALEAILKAATVVDTAGNVIPIGVEEPAEQSEDDESNQETEN